MIDHVKCQDGKVIAMRDIVVDAENGTKEIVRVTHTYILSGDVLVDQVQRADAESRIRETCEDMAGQDVPAYMALT